MRPEQRGADVGKDKRIGIPVLLRKGCLLRFGRDMPGRTFLCHEKGVFLSYEKRFLPFQSEMRSAPIPCGTGAIMKKFIFICNLKNNIHLIDIFNITEKYE